MIPFEKFTEQARMALARAQELLVRLQHQALDTEHLLLVLLGQAEGLVAESLLKLQFDRRPVLERLQQSLSQRPKAAQSGSLYMTNRLKSVLDRALADSERRGDAFVGTEHLLLAILDDPNDPAARLLRESGLEKDALSQTFDALPGCGKVDQP